MRTTRHPTTSQLATAETMLLALAARQHAVFSRAQALEAGATAAWLSTQVRSGAHERLPGPVYRVRALPESESTPAMAACLALGPHALLSHATAGALLGLDGVTPSDPPHVTVPLNVSPPPGLRALVHRSRSLSGSDRALIGPFPLTTPARTIIDLAGAMDEERFMRLLDDALVRGLVDSGRLQAVLKRLGTRGRPGAAQVAFTAELWSTGGIESQAEALFARWIIQHGLPEPARQLEVSDGRGRRARLDAAWRAQMAAVEVDGYAYHSDRASFVADRRRDSWLTSLGWTVLRTTPAELHEDAPDLLAALARLGVGEGARRRGLL
jgi:hypothetical protein